MSHDNFRVTYDGPALSSHEMDVRMLAPSLMAISDLLDRANTIINQGRANVKVKVRASPTSGSVNIDLSVVQDLISHTRDLLAGTSVTAAVNLIALLGFGATGVGGLMQVIGWARGRDIKAVENEQGNAVLQVEEGGEQMEVDRRVLELLRDSEVRQSVELMLQPLQHDGVDAFAVGDDKSIRYVISRQNVSWFSAPPASMDEVSLNVVRRVLLIERIEFSEDKKWRFTDGNSSFYASISDKAFFGKISEGAATFGLGDVLVVDMEERQRSDGVRLKAEYKVVKVHEHRRAMRQGQLPI